ncbi:MAG TPA: hypothetical protein VEJ87_01050 [Acidimicrobiales bacterium]|nr:hypothetical protein [Acidimicrobiales bacterium]
MSTGPERADLDDIASRLEPIAEEIAEIAMARLRQASFTADELETAELVADERRLTRARRSVYKAITLLRDPSSDVD